MCFCVDVFCSCFVCVCIVFIHFSFLVMFYSCHIDVQLSHLNKDYLLTYLFVACPVPMFCLLRNWPPLNADVTNSQSHSFNRSVSLPLPTIIYFLFYVIHLSSLDSERPHGSTPHSIYPKYCSFINLTLIHYHTPAIND